MDAWPATPENIEPDPRQLLQADLDSARNEHERLEHAIGEDIDIVTGIRSAIDTFGAAVWRDVFTQQQRAKRGANVRSALKLRWFDGYQILAIATVFIIGSIGIAAFQEVGAAFAGLLYGALSILNYVGLQGRSVEQIKKMRGSYLNRDGGDIRFVAFTHIDADLAHPLMGLDGPMRDLTFEDRAWKIPGVRTADALQETFLEVIDERRGNVLLTRFPDKKPTLVHADLENPFIRTYGVFFQRAIERHLSTIAAQADEFRAIVARLRERTVLAERVKRIEVELQEYDGTQAIMSSLPVTLAVRHRLLRDVVRFRVGENVGHRGTMLFADSDMDVKEVVQTVARASSASFVPFSFSSLQIGYVGQGAAQVARTFEAARRYRSILYVEDGDRLFNGGGSSGYEAMRREVLGAFTSQWDALAETNDVWIVAAGGNRDTLDPAMRGRFGTFINLTPDMHMKTEKIFVDDAGTVPEDAVLDDATAERVHVLSAMFAHVDAMERQAVIVPRAVLITGPFERAKTLVVDRIAAQSDLPLLDVHEGDLDAACARARGLLRAIVFVHVRAESDPGFIAHLCITIDTLTAEQSPIFVLVLAEDATVVDPELRHRIGETIDVSALAAAARRHCLLELIEGKPLDFDVDLHIARLDGLTEGMSGVRLREYVEEAIGRAALRAIERGAPESVRVTIEDFEPVGERAAT